MGALEAVALENGRLRAVIVPSLGARVWELADLERGRQWIWQRPGKPLAAHPVGADYDAVWAGGWEELFPNDAPGYFEGRALPDHGEWWATPWTQVDAGEGAQGRVRFAATLSVIRAECEKEFLLDAGAAALSVRYRIRSLEASPFHFLFKQHLAVRLTPDCRLQLPGGSAEPVDPQFGNLLPGVGRFAWPLAQTPAGVVDLSRVPPASSRRREFLYVRQVPAGWCGVDDPAADATLRLGFDRDRMPYVWLFLSYGGWHDLYTAVLEPCTNLPKDLAEAARLGQSARLEAGGTFETSVTIELGRLSTGIHAA